MITHLDQLYKQHPTTIPSDKIVTMVDSMTEQKITKHSFTCCFWCRHEFIGIAIGCPINYIHSRVHIGHVSKTTGDTYTNSHSLCENEVNNVPKTQTIESRGYYETDGIFCSFECCMAFILDKKDSIEYTRSENLIARMYIDFYGHYRRIYPAPSWRLLRNYGGHLTIEDFRGEFGKQVYNISRQVKISPVGIEFVKTTIFN